MSAEEPSTSFSSLSVGNRGLLHRLRRVAVLARLERAAQDLHALFHVERGGDPGPRHPQRGEGDGDGGLHADHHRLRVEHARDGGDGAQHAAEKGTHDRERGDVDEPRPRAMLDDALGEVLLKRRGQPIVHVHLHGDEEILPHLQDRYAIHGKAQAGRGVGGPTASPARWSATANAPARVALVVTSPSSTPRCTMVWAIWGRMPLMRQSAPMSRAAATVLSRCWATRVSTVGTPVMSMMAMLAPVSTMRVRSDSITSWVRSLSRVPMSGRARMPFQSSTTGVESSSMVRCWLRMTSSRPFWYISIVRSPSLSSSSVTVQSSVASAVASPLCSRWRRANSGSFSEKTNI